MNPGASACTASDRGLEFYCSSLTLLLLIQFPFIHGVPTLYGQTAIRFVQ